MHKTTVIPFFAALSLTPACYSPNPGSTESAGESTGTTTAASDTGSDSSMTRGPSDDDSADGSSSPGDGTDSSGGSTSGATATATADESGDTADSDGSTGETAEPPIDADLYVDALTGDDSNDGSYGAPMRTITAALAAAGSGDVVAVFPGQYDQPHGETFPLEIGEDVIVVGDPSHRGMGVIPTRILGNGAIDADTGAAIELDNGAEIRGFAIASSPDLLSFGIYVATNATIAQNTFDLSYGGVRLAGGGSQIEHNTFETNSYGVYGCDGGTGVISTNHFVTPALPVDIRGGGYCDVLNNLIEGNGQVGMQNQGGADLVTGNIFDRPAGYTYGCFSGSGGPVLRDNVCGVETGMAMRVTGSAPLDLGTPEDPGGNTFGTDNAVGIVVTDSADVQAVGNTWATGGVICGVDVELEGTGSVTYGAMQTCD